MLMSVTVAVMEEELGGANLVALDRIERTPTRVDMSGSGLTP